MKKIVINGREIRTNLGEPGSETIVPGNNLPNRVMMIANFAESDEEFVSRLVEYGYTTIRLAKVSTMVRGIHDTVAYCKK